jgi:hypothetical protein
MKHKIKYMTALCSFTRKKYCKRLIGMLLAVIVAEGPEKLKPKI